MSVWSFEHSVEATVAPDTAWRFWTTVSNWTFDPSLEWVALEPAFVTGAKGVTKPRGADPVAWCIRDVAGRTCHDRDDVSWSSRRLSLASFLPTTPGWYSHHAAGDAVWPAGERLYWPGRITTSQRYSGRNAQAGQSLSRSDIAARLSREVVAFLCTGHTWLQRGSPGRGPESFVQRQRAVCSTETPSSKRRGVPLVEGEQGRIETPRPSLGWAILGKGM